eukprot:7412119-Pyramimonas_sp.AAC.1
MRGHGAVKAPVDAASRYASLLRTCSLIQYIMGPRIRSRTIRTRQGLTTLPRALLQSLMLYTSLQARARLERALRTRAHMNIICQVRGCNHNRSKCPVLGTSDFDTIWY